MLKLIRNQVARTQRAFMRLRTLERKTDTRQKIQLGGLVKKAGLADETSAVLLGLLLEAQETLLGETGSKARARWRLKGDLAFSSEKIS